MCSYSGSLSCCCSGPVWSPIPTVPATLFIYKGQNYVYHTVQVRNSYVLVETYHSSVAIGMETSSAHVLGCRGKYTPQLSKTIHQETYSSGNFVNHNFIFILLDMLAIKL